ncbi:hypothetical protein XbC2_342 [Xanthomonas phage XbC2]|nr:hypothetical protein XbC2_342 [Xanthomonas phage XbC2]
MSMLVLILSMNGSITTVQLPLKVNVDTCETKTLPEVRKSYRMPLQVVSAKCFSTEE